MATADSAVSQLEERSRRSLAALPSWLRRLLTPSFCDLFFITIVCWRFLAGEGWSLLLMDGDTGWHIRAGQWILEHARVPATDLFSFSKPGEPWFAWEWLSDVGLALLHAWAGLKGVVLAAGLIIALWVTLLLRHAMWAGANPLVALGLSLAAFTAASIHFHARPHLTTLLLVAVTVRLLDRDRREPTRAVWALVPLAALWTNLHGGWLVLLVLVALMAVGTAIEARLAGRPAMASSRRHALLLACCAVATALNPYGLALHRHVASYLQDDWIKTVVGEFQSPSFRGEAMACFELLLIAGVLAVIPLLRARRVTESLWLLFFAHAALTSARHITVYVTVAVPIVAVLASEAWRRWVATRPLNSAPRVLEAISADFTPGMRRNSLAAAGFVAMLAAGSGAWLQWPSDFHRNFFPAGIIDGHRERIASARVLTKDQWADYLIYRSWPAQKVFFDGRSDFYGRKLWAAYDDMSSARANWREQMTRHGIDLVLAPVQWPLVTVLRQSGWRTLAENKQAVLLAPASVTYSADATDSRTRISGVIPTPFGAKDRNARLMKKTAEAESTRRKPAK